MERHWKKRVKQIKNKKKWKNKKDNLTSTFAAPDYFWSQNIIQGRI